MQKGPWLAHWRDLISAPRVRTASHNTVSGLTGSHALGGMGLPTPWKTRTAHTPLPRNSKAMQAPAKPTLYHIPRTMSSPIVMALLELRLVPHLVDVCVLDFPGLKTPEFVAMNPNGSSPTFRSGDLVLYESGAILTHLLEKYDTSYLLHPPMGCPTRPVYLREFFYAIATVYPFMAPLFLHLQKPEAEQDAEYVARSKAKWREVIGPLLASVLGDKAYHINTHLSAVDLLLAKPLLNADELGLLEGFPTLKALFQRVSQRKSFAAAYSPDPRFDGS